MHFFFNEDHQKRGYRDLTEHIISNIKMRNPIFHTVHCFKIFVCFPGITINMSNNNLERKIPIKTYQSNGTGEIN